jgi:hypothetical protein
MTQLRRDLERALGHGPTDEQIKREAQEAEAQHAATEAAGEQAEADRRREDEESRRRYELEQEIQNRHRRGSFAGYIAMPITPGDVRQSFKIGEWVANRSATIDPEAVADATGDLFATLDWLNPFHNEADNFPDIDNDYDNSHASLASLDL